jgi:hypothetical protein
MNQEKNNNLHVYSLTCYTFHSNEYPVRIYFPDVKNALYLIQPVLPI